MSGVVPISWADYSKCDATDLARLVANGEVSAKELATQAAMAVELINPDINGVIEVFLDTLADPYKDGMNAQGPFHGVPMMIKDLGSRMKGRQQEAGYAWMDQHIAEEDDCLIKNFRTAGFNLIGRTTTPEDGMAAVTETIKFGITRNPWNLNHSSGGSSGGSAASVASGILPVCSASDGGGSIRLPASWNGLIGLKNTRGRLPMPTGVHEASLPSAVEGVVTRSVRDTAAIHDAICHKPLGTGFMPYPNTQPLLSELTTSTRKFRVALSTGNWSRNDVIPAELIQRTNRVASWLEDNGHSVELVDDHTICDFETLFEAYKVGNWIAPLSNVIPQMAEAFGVTLTPENTSYQTLQMIKLGKGTTYADFAIAMDKNVLITRQWGQFWERGFDLLLTPTMADLCPPVNSEKYALASPLSFEQFFDHAMDLCRYVMPANETGLPAISLPAGLDSNGCPMGVQFYAPWNHEHDLIHIAGQMELAMPHRFNCLAPLNVGRL
jgi:amidase